METVIKDIENLIKYNKELLANETNRDVSFIIKGQLNGLELSLQIIKDCLE